MVNVPAAGALKPLALSVACMSAAAALLARRIGINIDYLYPPQPGLIFNKLLELEKRPVVQGIFI